MQLLSGHSDMNMHELLAGHLRGTVGVVGFGCDAEWGACCRAVCYQHTLEPYGDTLWTRSTKTHSNPFLCLSLLLTACVKAERFTP